MSLTLEQLQDRLAKLETSRNAGNDPLSQEIAALQGLVEQFNNIESDHFKQAAFLQQLFDLIPIGIAIHINGIITMINPTGVRVLRARSEEELLGKKAIDFVHPDFRERAMMRIQQLLDEPAQTDFSTVPFVEEKFLTVDGEPFDVEAAGIRMAPTEEGTPILVLWRDITEQKRQHRALEESEARFRQLVSLLPDGVVIHKDQKIIFVNEAAVKMMKVDEPEQLIGRTVGEFLLPEERTFVEQRIQQLLTRWEALPISKNHLVRPNGETFLVEVRAFPFMERGEKAILLVVRDITEQERMREELEKREARFRLLADLLPAVVYLVDEHGEVLYLNQSLDDWWGYSLDEIKTMDYFKIIDREDLLHALKVFRSLKLGESAYYELRVLDKSGAAHWVAVRTTKTMLEDRIVGLGVALDITWRKEMEQALKQLTHRLVTSLEEERRRIANELHDEVGQQLVGMKFALERALRQVQPTAARDAIQDAMHQLADLTEQVRELSLSFRPAMLDNLGLLPTLLWHFKRYAARTGIHVRFQQKGLDEVRLPQSHAITIYRVVQEALTNIARHADVDEAAVEIRVSSDRLFLKIVDNGRGFAPDEVLRNYQSTGLKGMMERVELLSGELTIHSQPQKGTTILATIPLSSPSDFSQ